MKVVMNRKDNARTGANLNETQLTVASIRKRRCSGENELEQRFGRVRLYDETGAVSIAIIPN